MLDALLQASINDTAVETSQAKAAVKEAVTNWLQRKTADLRDLPPSRGKKPPQKLPLNLC